MKKFDYITEVYNATEEDVLNYLKSKNPKQKNLSLKDYSDIYDFDEEVFKRAKKLGLDIKKDERLSKKLQTNSPEVKKLQSEITKNIRAKAKSEVINLRKLAPKNAKGNDVNPSIDYLDQKDIDFIQKEIKTKGYASIGPEDMDLSCRGGVFTYGNKKLPYWTMIFNMTSAKNCPSTECGLRDICYAKKSNNTFKSTLYRDLRNQAMLKFISATDFLRLMYAYIETSKVRIKHIRINEAGDFETQEQVNIAERFAKILWHKYRIKVVIYTARSLDFSKCKYLIVNASNKNVGSPTRYYFCRKKEFLNNNGISTNTKSIKQYTNSKGETKNYFFCHCNCYKCNFCYNTVEENGEDPNNPTEVFCLPH